MNLKQFPHFYGIKIRRSRVIDITITRKKEEDNNVRTTDCQNYFLFFTLSLSPLFFLLATYLFLLSVRTNLIQGWKVIQTMEALEKYYEVVFDSQCVIAGI